MGSQISNVRDIANGMREAVRYFVELHQAGPAASATWTSAVAWASTTKARARAASARSTTAWTSTPHTMLQPLAEACAEHGLTPPMMMTEAGRAMTAHHAVMVVNVSEVERAPEGSVPAEQAGRAGGRCATCAKSTPRSTSARRSSSTTRPSTTSPKARRCTRWASSTLRTARALDDLFYAIAHAVRARLTGRRAQPPRGARRAERAPGRQVLRQLLGVRVDPGRLGDRPGVPDRADRAPGRSARPPRRDRRPDLRLRRPHRHLRRIRGARQLAAAARAARRRELPARHLHGRRLPGDAGRHPQPVRRHRHRQRAARRRRRLLGRRASARATPPT